MPARRPRPTEQRQLEELRDLVARMLELETELESARKRRDDLVVGLRVRGISMRRIAKFAGFHFTRVAQIVAARKGGTLQRRVSSTPFWPVQCLAGSTN